MGLNHWIITHDHITDAPHTATPTHALGWTSTGALEALFPVAFRLKDGDQKVIYEGRMLEAGFDPLDEFGEGNAGCTTLEYRETSLGKWKTL